MNHLTTHNEPRTMNYEPRTTNYEQRTTNYNLCIPPIQPSLPINNAGRHGLNRLYTKYYRLTTNCPSTTVESALQISSFMQNKANLMDALMNVNLYNTTDYENKWQRTLGENKPNTNPIQSQSKPKQTQFTGCSNEHNSLSRNKLRKKGPIRLAQEQSQTNPIQTRSAAQIPTGELL